MLDIVFYFVFFIFLIFTYSYIKEKKTQKNKIPFHKERLK